MARFLQACLIVILGLFIYQFGGRFEGRIWPVVNQVQIEYEPADGTHVYATGEFFILRPGCDFRGLEWVYIGVSRETVADVEFLEGTVERPGGRNVFGPWSIQLTEQQMMRSQAIVFHQCPGRPWLTETLFYTGQ